MKSSTVVGVTVRKRKIDDDTIKDAHQSPSEVKRRKEKKDAK